MDRNSALEFVRITEAAALASARLRGRGDLRAADAAAVEAMRSAFERVPLRGEIVIGEGEIDEAPMLYIGEKVGAWGEHHPPCALAVDPLEGTSLCAHGREGSLSLIAGSNPGGLLHAPDVYMRKIAVGTRAAEVIDLTLSATDNLHRIAEAKSVPVGDLTVVVLDRSRHADLIAEIRAVGSRIKLITDGDVHAAIAAADDDTDIDVLFGVGGAPEGVLAAAAIRCIGGNMQAQLVFRNSREERRAASMGLDDPRRVLTLDDLASGDVVFAATGVTDGPMVRGVRFIDGGAITESIVMRARTGTIRHVRSRHNFARKPGYSPAGIGVGS